MGSWKVLSFNYLFIVKSSRGPFGVVDLFVCRQTLFIGVCFASKYSIHATERHGSQCKKNFYFDESNNESIIEI